MSRAIQLMAALAMLCLALPDLAFVSLVNIDSLGRSAWVACGAGRPCAETGKTVPCGESMFGSISSAPALPAGLVRRVGAWRQEADAARLSELETELTLQAIRGHFEIRPTTLSKTLIWRLPCNTALLRRTEREALHGGASGRDLLSELYARRRGAMRAAADARAGAVPDLQAAKDVAAAMGKGTGELRFGEDLISDQGRCVAGARTTRTSPWATWRYEPPRHRIAMFVSDWDCYDSFTERGSLRASGLWLDRTGDASPARVTFVTAEPVSMHEGFFAFSMVYRTRDGDEDSVAIGLDPLVGFWGLPPTDGVWRRVVVVVWNGKTGSVLPMLSSSGRGTVWFDEIRLRQILFERGESSVDRATKYILQKDALDPAIPRQ